MSKAGKGLGALIEIICKIPALMTGISVFTSVVITALKWLRSRMLRMPKDLAGIIIVPLGCWLGFMAFYYIFRAIWLRRHKPAAEPAADPRLQYTQRRYGNFTYAWDYAGSPGAYRIVNLRVVCPKCVCVIGQDIYGRIICPICGKEYYGQPNYETIVRVIASDIDSGRYKNY
jgi:hypothetical protein